MADTVVCVTKKFHPPKSFSFPKRSFGSRAIQRSFRSKWCQEFEWLHYDAAADAAYYHLCLCAEVEKNFLVLSVILPSYREATPIGRILKQLSQSSQNARHALPLIRAFHFVNVN